MTVPRANIFMGKVETSILNKNALRPLVWNRFIASRRLGTYRKHTVSLNQMLTVTGSQLFPYFTFLHNASFILLSSFHSQRQIFVRDSCSFLSSRGVKIFRKSETNFSPTTTDQNLIITNATKMTVPAILHPAEKNSYLLPQSIRSSQL